MVLNMNTFVKNDRILYIGTEASCYELMFFEKGFGFDKNSIWFSSNDNHLDCFGEAVATFFSYQDDALYDALSVIYNS